MMNDLKRLIGIIEEHESFFLLSHLDPDGDAIGSLIAFLLLLRRKGKRAVAYDVDGVPEIYRFLDGSDQIVSTIPSSEQFDAVIFLECPSVERAGSACEQIIKDIPLWVNLDHHADNMKYGHLNIIESGLSALGELVYDLYDTMGEPIDITVANALYTAIMTDTGSFKYSNTTPRAHEISVRLIELGVKPYEVYQEVFEKLSPQAALIAARAHSTLAIEDGIAYITITRAMLEESGAGPEDTHDIVSLGRAIGDVEVALLFRETENNIKVSLRSKNRVDVNKIAVRFGGGGHVRAAGCNIEGDMQRVKEQIFEAVRMALKDDRLPDAGTDGH